MKTRIILQGGFNPGEKQENDPFFHEILNFAPKNAKILLVYFAKEENRIDANSREDIEQFEKNKGERNLYLEIATKDAFMRQLAGADIVYLHGGRTEKLLNALKEFPGFADAIRGKIVAGDSAGANVLSSVFYSMSMGIGEGLGILPIKIICHYKEENKEMLQEIRPELETLLLPEYQIKVYEI
ncbi:MAG: hypothetical protein JWO73_155 [Candidatus Taylorbacteria bacterium]|nr:hypothetical protein [Candidatus Taylorbacteria bacterium]